MRSHQKKLIAISGCSGGGKSTLLAELKNNGYTVFPEVGREIVKEQLKIKGDITPWQNPKLFCKSAIQRSLLAYKAAKEIVKPKEGLIFFDRCFLDGISYYQTFSDDNPNKYDDLIEDFRLYPTVFVTPPWEEIFSQDSERKHSFEDAVSEYNRLLKFYAKSGYHVVEIPKTDTKTRLQFLITLLNKH